MRLQKDFFTTLPVQKIKREAMASKGSYVSDRPTLAILDEMTKNPAVMRKDTVFRFSTEIEIARPGEVEWISSRSTRMIKCRLRP